MPPILRKLESEWALNLYRVRRKEGRKGIRYAIETAMRHACRGAASKCFMGVERATSRVSLEGMVRGLGSIHVLIAALFLA